MPELLRAKWINTTEFTSATPPAAAGPTNHARTPRLLRRRRRRHTAGASRPTGTTTGWMQSSTDACAVSAACVRTSPYRDLIDSPKAPATIDASVIGVAAAALRNAMNVLDPHEGGDWEDAWHTIADLEDCAIRARKPLLGTKTRDDDDTRRTPKPTTCRARD